jgi:hypothetical protein
MQKPKMKKRGTMKPVKLSARPSILVLEPELSASMSNHQTSEEKEKEKGRNESSSSFVFNSDQTDQDGTDLKTLTNDKQSNGFDLNRSFK